jgi:hypothetical protein
MNKWDDWLERQDWMTGKMPEPVLVEVDPSEQESGGAIVWLLILTILAGSIALFWFLVSTGHGIKG